MDKIGVMLAILLLLVTIQSTFYFLGRLKVKMIEWIVFNACAPSNITFLIGFILYLFFKDRTVLHIAILPMVFFGVGGLIVFPWSGMSIIPQISHIIMAFNIGWTIFITIKTEHQGDAITHQIFEQLHRSVITPFDREDIAMLAHSLDEDFRFHDLRHTFATRLVQAGKDLYQVQSLLGHKSPAMTQRYAHHYPESLRDAVEALDQQQGLCRKSVTIKEKGISRFELTL